MTISDYTPSPSIQPDQSQISPSQSDRLIFTQSQSSNFLTDLPSVAETATPHIPLDNIQKKSKYDNKYKKIAKEADLLGIRVHHEFSLFLNQIKDVVIMQLNKEKNQTITIDYTQLVELNEELAKTITNQYYRLEPYLHKALHDVLETSITENINNIAISFKNYPTFIPLRKLNTSQLGRLTKFSSTVTRCSQVKPELVEGKFKCNECGCIYEETIKQQFKYTEPTMCQTNMCSNKSNWTLISKESKFLDWQCIRAQENSVEIPSGSMPRTMEIILRGNLVEKVKPGDNIFVTGCLIVIPDLYQIKSISGSNVQLEKENPSSGNAFSQNMGVSGLKALGPRDLTYRVSFLANNISIYNCSEVEDIDEFTSSSVIAKELAPLMHLINNPRTLYQKLVSSISPTVFGHENIKKGILLQLLSGVQKTTSEGIRLRGDINICIVGDPSTSKSQFLKYVTHYFPRSVYTSGKASSAAGLTASVVRDEDSGEYTVEAGALMLADQGICAIDEFDKMNLYDQVAIHEAMEQQTISIAKAGVHATLNARASILAAANPVNGRYNKKLSLRQNVSMTAPIMSRFDLFFIVLDEPDLIKDTNLASHIVKTHGLEKGLASADNEDIIELELLRKFILFARTIKPMLTPEAKKMLADCYRMLRIQDMQGVSKNSYRITVRQLESMIRLSEAIAKAHLDEKIKPDYVREAFQLLRHSIVLVEQDNVECFLDDAKQDPLSTEPITDETTQVRSEATQSQSTAPKSIKLDREKYESIKRMLLIKLNNVEESENEAMKLNDLVQWYLEQKEKDIDTEEQLEQELKLIKVVINHMIKKDSVLITLKENNTQDENDQLTLPADDNPIILVHPNYQT